MTPSSPLYADLELAVRRMRVAVIVRLARRMGYPASETEILELVRTNSDDGVLKALRRSAALPEAKGVVGFILWLTRWRA
jgi:hypothetical protein